MTIATEVSNWLFSSIQIRDNSISLAPDGTTLLYSGAGINLTEPGASFQINGAPVTGNTSVTTNPIILPPAGGTDAALTINAAISKSIASGGGTITIGPGLYRLQGSPINIVGNNLRVVCDPSAVFQAQDGFVFPNWPMVQIRGNNIEWSGGIFDANNIAGSGLQLADANTRVVFINIEVKNFTQYGMWGADRTAGIWEVYNCYLHGGNSPGVYDLTEDGNTCRLIVRDCWFDSINNIACGASNAANANGTAYYEASGNLFTNCGGPQQALYGFQAGLLNWHHNVFISCSGALHSDTCGGGSICDNHAKGATGLVDFFVEATPYVSVERNISEGNMSYGILLGVGGTATKPSSTQVPLVGISCSSNKIINCFSGIAWGALQQGVFSNNYVENPANGIAYQNENSAGIRFISNQSNFSSGGTHLNVDGPVATATVYASNDITNAETIYSQTNGGQVLIIATAYTVAP